MAQLYSAVDVLVIPSVQENLPYVVMESMACGTPCVGFDIGGIPDMIEHQFNGYLAPPYEVNDLAAGIAWTLEDAERWKLLSRRCVEKVNREYDLRAITRRYLALYRDILGES
jgi:glycosyltransferase involved in cell wall biosynthesis